jgi:glycosyltransferase involved in cell wall biosynthesis
MNHLALLVPGIDRLGGAERQVLQLAQGLHRREWHVTVIALSGTGGDAAAELATAGIDFLSLGMRKGLADPVGWLRLQGWIRRRRPDILHGHLPHAAWMARWSRVFAPVRVVVDTVHTFACGTYGRRVGYRCSNWLADAVTAVSHGAADAYAKARMITQDRLVVIPNGVDLQHWRAATERRAALRAKLRIGDEFLWLAAGRMEPVKNFPALLDAFAHLSPSARLVIAGAGPMERELRAQCTRLGLDSRVTFPGFDTNLLRWMQVADAFVLPSLWEGLPMVLLEAGACGLPAVATDVPGSRDVVVHGRTGLLTMPGDAAALTEAMDALMRFDPAALAAMGDNARLQVQAHFDVEAVIARWDGFYRQLLRERRTAARWARVGPSQQNDSRCVSKPKQSSGFFLEEKEKNPPSGMP